MDLDSLLKGTDNAPRKVKHAPKAPPRRPQKVVATKIEKSEADNENAEDKELLRRLNEASVRVKGKVEKKAPARVAFGHGGSSTYLKSYSSKGGASSNRFGGTPSDGVGADSSGLRVEKEYKEPWDYYNYYPMTLPMRRPYSGNPELLDEKEFGKASESATYDEQLTKPGIELGLMEEDIEERLIYLQLPATMPMVKKSVKMEDKGTNNLEAACGINELPGGQIGKMLVYRSGAVKLKVGDIIYDVSGGLDCVFAQDVVAINTEKKHCCIVGELGKRAIVTPDVDSVLNAMSRML